MGRNIVLCFDGTSNRYAATNTNVVRLYEMLERGGTDQLAYYQPGIGTLDPPGLWEAGKRWLYEKIDLAVAWFLQEHVVAGYRFLMRYWQAGDQIFIFGFSRGAYTARALAGMLYKIGLLSMGNEELLPFAWDMYRTPANEELAHGFRATFARPVPVKFLGLWDTVSSVGLLFNRSLPYTANNPLVEVVRHAVSLDERRVKFVQNLWKRDHAAASDVQEVWFAGVHCDIGGGYEPGQAGLAKITLAWMARHAELHGVKLDAAARARILPERDAAGEVAPDPAGRLHASLHGLWWLVEYLPLPYKDPRQNYATRWRWHRGWPRHVEPGANIHASVLERRRRVPEYAPPNLPADYTEVA